MANVEELVKGILTGDRRMIARAISVAENNPLEAQRLIAAVYPRTGRAHVVGLTGAGGVGKSTLAEKIIHEYRRRDKTVGVVAVDPTSPFTGGAFLGDRIRMQELTGDEGVFIRSMATRNYVGGIAKATRNAVRILDAAGKDVVLVEAVGAGQSEVEIVKVAHTVVVMHAPGLGNEIQAIKAGIMEIADIFVVNKADRENAAKTATDIQGILQLGGKEGGWKVPVLKTIALTGEGVAELVDKIGEHRQFLQSGGGTEREAMRIETELVEAVKDKVAEAVFFGLRKREKFQELLKKIIDREIDPASAADELLRKMGID
ncbi:MAG: methylmalonyl Co-A mutase-associated GTPase MeaB [Candidatus Bathyarchaeota archaeon]|nr:methylmalonyl Co-A mutase-associated GTPase MeaB [Candidatus Bathyarchaeota archaeon]